MKKSTLKLFLFTLVTTGLATSAFAAQYVNDTEYAKTNSDYYDPDIWRHPADYSEIPNWTAYPDDNNTQAHVDLFNDIVMSKGTEYSDLYEMDYGSNDVTLQMIWFKGQNKTFTINDGITLTLTGGMNADAGWENDASDKMIVNEGGTLTTTANTGRAWMDILGGTVTVGGISGKNNDEGKGHAKIYLESGSLTNTGSTSYADIVMAGGTLNVASLSNTTLKVDGGEVVSTNGYIQNNTKLTITGGTYRFADVNVELLSSSTLTLLGGEFKGTTPKKANLNINNSTTLVNFGGGKISTFNQISTQGGSQINFGYTDENGKFHAAAAHSIDSDWKILLNGTTWKFNAGSSNLIKSDDATDLKTNAFAYAATEFQFWTAAEDTDFEYFTLDFSNLDFTALETGKYYLSLIACEINFHANDAGSPDPIFDFIDEKGVSQSIAMSEDVKYNDNLTFKVIENSNSTIYYVEMNITQAIIPEPSTYAAIFGALALAIATYRRKK